MALLQGCANKSRINPESDTERCIHSVEVVSALKRACTREVLSLPICVVLVLTALPVRAATAPNPDMPLYIAFKLFCADTGAKSGAVRRTVEAAGGLPHNPSGGSTENGTFPNGPFPKSLAIWDVTRRKMMVFAGGDHSSPE